ncbi:MAG TPA: serine/threonine-protein kinase [Urbifossiella sp.]|nr:serine/threonine-protein kinase [Urbifossiella sp.]
MPTTPGRAQAVFVAAAEITDPAARASFVAEACGDDPGLKSRVEALLRAHDQPDSFLDAPLVAPPDPDHASTRAFAPDPDPAATSAGGTPGDAEDDEVLSFLTPSARPDSLGRIGHYELLQVLGKGGFGVVFRAFDDILQRVVAVKVMAPQLAATSPARKRFLREARTSAAVRHENVVQVYEVAEQPLPYLAMEFIPGETLQQKLDRNGPLDVPEVVRLGRQIAEGLAAAHATDLIHRDIKPANVLIEGGPRQQVKITDFGLARAADDASISQSGLIAGTPMYMAPEQALGQDLDQRADLFSLGSVLYQMAAGRPPFRANNTVAVLKRVAEDTPRDIRAIIPETPSWLCDIIAKLHAKKPDDRYQSARDVADVLADCEAQLKANSRLKDFSRIPRGKPTPRPPGRRKWVAAAAVLLLPLIALAGTELAGMTHLFRGPQATNHPVEPVGGPPPPHIEIMELPASQADAAPFVVVAKDAKAERQCATLTEAVTAAQSGDTIELRGDGPFVTDGVHTEYKALTIRAGTGFRPVLRLSPHSSGAGQPLLKATAALVLEGLDLQSVSLPAHGTGPNTIRLVSIEDASLHVANCRFAMKRQAGPPYGLACLTTDNCRSVEVRNCVLLEWYSLLETVRPPAGAAIVIENCVLKGLLEVGINLHQWRDVRVGLNHNTFAGQAPCLIHLYPNDPQEIGSCEVTWNANIVSSYDVCMVSQQIEKDGQPVSQVEAEKQLRRWLTVKDKRNVFSLLASGAYMTWTVNHQLVPGHRPHTSLAAWEQFWDLKDTGSTHAKVRFKNGQVLAQKDGLTPDNFRLVAGSPGQGILPGGKDVGAEIDFVGSGAAYENWKQTPAYQEWLGRTGRTALAPLPPNVAPAPPPPVKE